MSYSLESRSERYVKISTALARLSDQEILRQLRRTKSMEGWGTNQVLRIERQKVFVKRIPVTDKELANPYSTKNTYQIPTYYNYGVGSAGFGVFRELYSHVKTTNWVLGDECQAFPMMYHHRIIRGSKSPKAVDEEQLSGYVSYWNGSQRIGNYLRDRVATANEVFVFLEYFPFTAGPRLLKHRSEYMGVLQQMLKTAAFLQSKHVIHFDAHLFNILTDGDQAYLTDFGLVLDLDFDLNSKEQTFFKTHKSYDTGQLLHSLEYPILLPWQQDQQLAAKLIKDYGFANDDYPSILAGVLNNLEDIVSRKLITVEPKIVKMVLRHRDVITMMGNFYFAMKSGTRKNIPFNGKRLSRLLNRR